ncbi:MAG: HEAT repeat domain-containing protein [Terriglobia bacterium]
MPLMPEPSLDVLRTALVVMGLSTVSLAVGVYFLMQVRFSRDIARQARRLMFANLVVPPWDGKNLESLWASSTREDREIIEEVLADQSQFLEGKEAATFERAVAECAIYGGLLHKLQLGPTFQKVHAAKILGYFHDPRGIQALANSIQDRTPEIALACLISLGRLKSSSAIPAIIGFLQTRPALVPDITIVATLSACALERPGSLAGLLDSHEERSRIVGAWAISEIADQTVLPPLLKAAHDSHPEVRAKVARALARAPNPTSVETLISLAQDPVWFVRVRALDALGQLHAPAGETIALAALTDQVREVRYRAAFAVRQIKGMKGEVVVQTLTARSRLSFDSLISEWERAGFMDSVVDELSGQDGTRVDESKEILRVLIAAGVTSTLDYLVLVHRNIEVRLALLLLLLKNRD